MIQIALDWSVSIILVMLRIGPLFVWAPPFSQIKIPARVRVCLVAALSVCIASSSVSPIHLDSSTLLWVVASEAMLGWLIVFAFQAAFAALSFAGRVLDVQAGYGLATFIDPGSRAQAPLFGAILTLAAGCIFFSADGHHALLRVCALLMHEVWPVGRVSVLDHPTEMLTYFGSVMGIGLSVAAPAILVLFLVDVLIAFLARTLPQMNALLLGLQVKVVVTLLVQALSAGLIVPVMLRLTQRALGMISVL